MHPNVFLKTFWQAELRPEIFVAMTFSEEYRPRFEEVIAPAIRAVKVGDVPLEPRRVDESRSGDEILTEIMDGIAHSQMVLADVSTLGRDPDSGRAYRNGNVMYEVGIALACRQPTEVLLIRDDRAPFLFDVSTIPHMTLDFTEGEVARTKLTGELVARLNERQLVADAGVRLAISGLSREEVMMLRHIEEYASDRVWGKKENGTIDFIRMAAIPRLLDKQLIRVAGQFEQGHVAYETTALGLVVARLVKSGLRSYVPDEPPEVAAGGEEGDAGPDDEQPTPGEPTSEDK